MEPAGCVGRKRTSRSDPQDSAWVGIGEVPSVARIHRAGEQRSWGLHLGKSGSKGHAIASVPEGKTVSKNDHPTPLGYLGGLEMR